MTMASGCTAKNLVRLGGGSLRSLVVLAFLAISAYMTLKGLFGQWRASLLDPVSIDLSTPGLGQIVAYDIENANYASGQAQIQFRRLKRELLQLETGPLVGSM